MFKIRTDSIDIALKNLGITAEIIKQDDDNIFISAENLNILINDISNIKFYILKENDKFIKLKKNVDPFSIKSFVKLSEFVLVNFRFRLSLLKAIESTVKNNVFLNNNLNKYIGKIVSLKILGQNIDNFYGTILLENTTYNYILSKSDNPFCQISINKSYLSLVKDINYSIDASPIIIFERSSMRFLKELIYHVLFDREFIDEIKIFQVSNLMRIVIKHNDKISVNNFKHILNINWFQIKEQIDIGLQIVEYNSDMSLFVKNLFCNDKLHMKINEEEHTITIFFNDDYSLKRCLGIRKSNLILLNKILKFYFNYEFIFKLK